MLDGIPPSQASDPEDVVWALQTADSLWKRNERVDAVVWLRRAAQAAGEAEQDDRALALARGAAELSDLIARGPSASAAPVPVPSASAPPSNVNIDVDDLMALLPVSQPPDPLPPPNPLLSEAISLPPDAISLIPDPISLPPAPTLHHAPAAPPVVDVSTMLSFRLPPPPPPIPDTPDDPSEVAETPIIEAPTVEVPTARAVSTSDAVTEEVPTAAQAHAGLLDPWSSRAPRSEPPRSGRSGRPPAMFDEDEVVTSAVVPPTKTRSAFPVEPVTNPKSNVPASAPGPSLHKVARVGPPPLPLPFPAPPSSAPADDAPPVSFEVASARTAAATAKKRKGPPPLPAMPAIRPLAPRVASTPLPPNLPDLPEIPPIMTVAVTEEIPVSRVPSVAMQAVAGVDLGAIEAFADLPDDARTAFEFTATMTDLSKNQETTGFALAVLVEGEVDVAATKVDATAARYKAPAVIRTRGTIDEELAIRLICASENASLATWTDEVVAKAFHSCPWVEDDLRAAANQMQALVGSTMGTLGQRLDKSIRDQVTGRLEVRSLSAGEIVVAQGQPMPGLVLVGGGTLELIVGDEVKGKVSPGEFLFASQVLSSGKAPSTARAAKGGTLVMTSSRAVAQELLVTCPPLLELFAGMM